MDHVSYLVTQTSVVTVTQRVPLALHVFVSVLVQVVVLVLPPLTCTT